MNDKLLVIEQIEKEIERFLCNRLTNKYCINCILTPECENCKYWKFSKKILKKYKEASNVINRTLRKV